MRGEEERAAAVRQRAFDVVSASHLDRREQLIRLQALELAQTGGIGQLTQGIEWLAQLEQSVSAY